VIVGTSLDHESKRSVDLGCWDGPEAMAPVRHFTAERVPEDWIPPEVFVPAVVTSGFSGCLTKEQAKQWVKIVNKNYAGDAGRRRLRQAVLNLCYRDGLHARAVDITVPVVRMHGSADTVYSIPNAQDEMKLLQNSPDAKLILVPGGAHYLSASHPAEVNAAVLELVSKHGPRL
jgi:pimeloyl-ACP methyl ester carboxylesterase